jgi:hypothetical protein
LPTRLCRDWPPAQTRLRVPRFTSGSRMNACLFLLSRLHGQRVNSSARTEHFSSDCKQTHEQVQDTNDSKVAVPLAEQCYASSANGMGITLFVGLLGSMHKRQLRPSVSVYNTKLARITPAKADTNSTRLWNCAAVAAEGHSVQSHADSFVVMLHSVHSGKHSGQ